MKWEDEGIPSFGPFRVKYRLKWSGAELNLLMYNYKQPSPGSPTSWPLPPQERKVMVYQIGWLTCL